MSRVQGEKLLDAVSVLSDTVSGLVEAVADTDTLPLEVYVAFQVAVGAIATAVGEVTDALEEYNDNDETDADDADE